LRSPLLVFAQVFVAERVAETVNLSLGLVFGDAVLLLNLSNELVPLPGDDIDVVVGELAPLLFGLALELLPVALDTIPVHLFSPREHSAGRRSPEHGDPFATAVPDANQNQIMDLARPTRGHCAPLAYPRCKAAQGVGSGRPPLADNDRWHFRCALAFSMRNLRCFFVRGF